ncbi:MAG TPA: 4-alpha-glucanotransferase [Candidatus Limnocylindrales bacterium]|nr:4-alpha-glucanotransferase [Candidatus Limnocylindrales bacterium]
MGETPQPAAWGIVPEYWDMGGTRHQPGPATIAGILQAMGAEAERPSPAPGVLMVRRGDPRPIDAPGELETEDGRRRPVEDRLPADLLPGYHTLHPRQGGASIRVIVSPGTCFLRDDLRTWGLALQLYALRSRHSWGVGDLADLRRFAGFARHDLGAGMTLLNPLHAGTPGVPQQPSPYFASSREFRNPLYLRVDEVPGARRLRDRLRALGEAGRRLNAARVIDRDAAYRLKLEALETLWGDFRGDARFTAYCEREGDALTRYGTFCVLAERLGPQFRRWPPELRHPADPAVEAFTRANARRVDFHRWLQWLLDEQLQRAGAQLPLIADLAVGVDPDGADAWALQDVLASGVRVGAPPDAFSPDGQDWGVPPFDPWKLRQAAYEPFIRIVRAAFRSAGGVRLDHVMGLFRLYWIPPGVAASEGAYVRYPASDLLDILALESTRAGALVVGEDLGTVEDETRAELARRRVLSYRLLWFEDRPPEAYPLAALAAITTHDLPTVAGVWTGADARAQVAAGLRPSPGAEEAMVRRLQEVTGLPREAPVGDVIAAAYAALARAPSQLVAATVEDALAVEERPNMPGTTDEWPNWSLALPLTLEEIMRDPRLRRLSTALAR